MTWWQVVLIFVGIPAILFTTISVVVMRLTKPRVADGITTRDKATPEEPEPHGGVQQPSDDKDQRR